MMRGTFYALLILIVLYLANYPGDAGRWFAQAQSAYFAERNR